MLHGTEVPMCFLYQGATGTHKIHSGSVEGVNLENLALDTIHAIVWNLTTCLALPIQIIA